MLTYENENMFLNYFCDNRADNGFVRGLRKADHTLVRLIEGIGLFWILRIMLMELLLIRLADELGQIQI
jgi:hypothetical protein